MMAKPLCVNCQDTVDALAARNGEWSRAWPTEPGTWWWFQQAPDGEKKAMLWMVLVVHSEMHWAHQFHGLNSGSIRPHDMRGVWQRIAPPAVPTLEGE